MPAEASPNRPGLADADCQRLREASVQAGPRVELFLYLAHETGHRSHAIRHLRWSDIDLDGGAIRWRASADKMGNEHQTPLLDAHMAMLKRYQRQSSIIGDTWVFPSADDPAKPVSRRETIRWWARLELLAGLRHEPGKAWHSLRRIFADDHDGLPLVQLMALGGWKSHKTVVEVYQKPKFDKLRQALASRRNRSETASLTTASDNHAATSTASPLPQVAVVG